ncbi:OmpA family protein [Xylophilus sp. ASV27]|uniref:OmpA family protein n=1 Tax=Xylophilus sp. ASV27 TaxID=2795129 RepID=UPI0018EA4EEE|nr:OmpA family protein [Xylophilus sp. ASV27]
MSFSHDEDGPQRLALGLVALVVLLVVASVVAAGVFHARHKPVRRAPAAPASVSSDAARVAIEDGIVKFYFAPGSSALAPGAEQALANVVKGVTVGRRALVLGYAGASIGPLDTSSVDALRVVNVREVLRGLGLPEDKIELRGRVSTTPTTPFGKADAANRVDVMLVD